MSEAIDDVSVELTPTDRIRSPGDVLRLLSGLVVVAAGLALAFFAQDTLGGAEADLARGLSRIPSRWERVLLGVGEVAVVTIIISVSIFLAVSRRLRLLGWLALAVVTASAVTFGLDWLLANNRVEVLQGADTVQEWYLADPNFPSSGLIAGFTAGVVFGSAWLPSRWRKAAWGVLVALLFLRVGFSADPSVDVIAAIGVGIVAGAGTLLWRGAPSLQPAGAELVRALRTAGLDPRSVRQIEPGHTTVTYLVETRTGQLLRVGLRTPHDRSADALTHMWRTIRLRPDEVDAPFNTIQQRVEHEALALEMAGRSGARVPDLVNLVGTTDGAIGIAEEHVDGTPVGADGPPTHELLVAAWDQLRLLHAAGIAHRNLRLDRFLVDDSHDVRLTGFRRARLVATDRERALDVAQLMADTAVAVGPTEAVSAARAALGEQTCAAAYPLLQPLALPRDTRREVGSREGLLEDLRQEVAEQCGAEETQLARIERVRPRTVVTVIGLTLAFYLVLPQLADIRSTADAFVEADLAWAPWIIVGSALSYVFAAVSFVGAVPETVPFLPALRAQVASSFVSLIAPASSGSLALGVRFLQRMGIDAAPAGAAVALDAIAGFVVHLALLVVFVVWSGSSGLEGFSLPDINVVIAIIAAVLGLAGLSLLNRRVRERVLGPLGRAARSAATSVGSVMTNPVRVAQLLGGSIGITLSYVLAAVASVEAFGGQVGVTQVTVSFLLAAGLASVAPTPGGLGAFEAAMITALTGFGMPSGAAVSATLAFRLATYWLPIPPGWVAFTWMQHHDEV